MTTKEKMEWALCLIFKKSLKACVHCEFGDKSQQEILGTALVMVGVPHGVYKTFVLDNHNWARFNNARIDGGCDLDYDRKFIDEVVSLVGE